MAGATIWKGFIRFGETDVAVKLHTAVHEERVQFHLLHGSDKVRLRQQMFCALEKHAVPPEEQARGYEMEPGKYLIVDPEDLDKVVPESSRTIQIHEFVPSSQIDPLFLERVYNLEPDMQGRGYRSLVRALTELECAGICTWTMRKRSYLGALQAAGETLRLTTLRYADEVVAAESLELEDAPLSEKELAIGSELIAKLTAPFEPAKFKDEHQLKLKALIEKKARGEAIEILQPRRLKPTEPDRLLEALEASLKNAA